jgi:hypothetical protein
MCGVENAVVGNGECGTNGNTKVFNAGESYHGGILCRRFKTEISLTKTY